MTTLAAIDNAQRHTTIATLVVLRQLIDDSIEALQIVDDLKEALDEPTLDWGFDSIDNWRKRRGVAASTP